jgi:hypothetical protein
MSIKTDKPIIYHVHSSWDNLYTSGNELWYWKIISERTEEETKWWIEVRPEKVAGVSYIIPPKYHIESRGVLKK